MHELALMAAEKWASANARLKSDPVQFGADVARAYLAAKATARSANDETTTAALAALSIPSEVLQSLAQPASHPTLGSGPVCQTHLSDVEG